MKILVTVKRIPDPDASLKFANGAIDTSAAKWVPNEFDQYAVETALRLAEDAISKKRHAEIVVCSVCPAKQRQHITTFLAMGADRGICVDADDTALDSQSIAKLIAGVFKKEEADLLICGKLSQDSEGNEVGQRVAGLLGAPIASFAGGVSLDQGSKTLQVQREVDDGVETKKIPMPSVITCDLRVVLPSSVKNGVTPDDFTYNEGPRLASLRGITMAKRKKVEQLAPADLGVDAANAIANSGVNPPPARAAGQIVETVEQLVEKLATEAKVL